MIEIKELNVNIDHKRILKDISVSWDPGGFHCVCGANGSGKTTFLKAICGFIPASSGHIIINGQDEVAKPAHDRNPRLGWVPAQQPVHFNYTGRDILYWKAVSIEKYPSVLNSQADATIHPLEMRDAIDLLGIGEILDKPIAKLSLGEQKRIQLARVLGSRAQILLLDEPTSGLDPAMALNLLDWLSTTSKDSGRTVIASLHDIQYAKRFAATVALLNAGQLIAHGSAAAIFLSEKLEMSLKVKWDEKLQGFRPIKQHN